MAAMPMSWFAASARWIKLDSAGSSKLRHHATSTAPEASPAAGQQNQRAQGEQKGLKGIFHDVLSSMSNFALDLGRSKRAARPRMTT